MQESLDAYQLLDFAPDGLLVVARNGAIVWANATAATLFGMEREELLTKEVRDLLPERFREGHYHLRQGYYANPRPRPMGLGMELRALRSDGTEFPVEISLSPIGDGPDPLVTAMIRDVSERHALEAERNHLAMSLEMERERDRIAMDLHDGIMQDIYASALALEVALAEEDPAESESHVERTIDQLHEVIRNIRSYIFDLRPREFAGNLAEALGDMSREFQQNSQVETEVIVEGEGELELATAVALYNVAHESLSNIQRHARCDHVTITLSFGEGSGLLIVSDNGVGFDTTVRLPEQHRGVRNMAARIRSIKGDFTIESAPGKGTTIRIEFPLGEVAA